MYICVCNAVTDRQIRRAVDEGASTYGQVRARLPVARCCGRCAEAVREVIDEHRDAGALSACATA